MKNAKDFVALMVSMVVGFVAWVSLKVENFLTERRNNKDNAVENNGNGPVLRKFHYHRHGIPFILVVIALIWANRQGYFQDYPGIQSFVNMVLYVTDQLLQFIMKLLDILVRALNIPHIWEGFQNLFWGHWLFK